MESLISFDERDFAGVRYFETVMEILGHTHGKKAVNWCVGPGSVGRRC